jgi:protease I
MQMALPRGVVRWRSFDSEPAYMKSKLNGKKIAVLVTDGFEQSEMTSPKEALERAGAEVHILAPSGEKVRAWDEEDWGETFRVNTQLKKAEPDDYDALLLPGGVINSDKLRRDKRAVDFVRAFFEAGKPVAAICHAPWTLIEAGVVPGRRMTSWPSLQTDLKNAGADWVDEPVVTDHGLVTSRKPADIPIFIRKVLEEFCEGIHTPIREPQSQETPEEKTVVE